MARTKKIIIKTWDLLLEDEKNNLEYLDKLKKGYEKQVTSFQSDKNYVRIANQIYKLNTSKTKSILAEAVAPVIRGIGGGTTLPISTISSIRRVSCPMSSTERSE